MSAPCIIISSWSSLCQKLSKLVEIGQSYAKNNFDFFLQIRRVLMVLYFD